MAKKSPRGINKEGRGEFSETFPYLLTVRKRRVPIKTILKRSGNVIAYVN